MAGAPKCSHFTRRQIRLFKANYNNANNTWGLCRKKTIIKMGGSRVPMNFFITLILHSKQNELNQDKIYSFLHI